MSRGVGVLAAAVNSLVPVPAPVLFLMLAVGPAPGTAHLSAFCTVSTPIHRQDDSQADLDCGDVPCSALYPNGSSITTVWLGTYHTDPIAHSNRKTKTKTGRSDVQLFIVHC